MTVYYQFLSGAAMMGAWIGGAFFLRFWRRTRDRLFLIFGIAFWILTSERVALLLLVDPSGEERSFIYLIRLSAFLLILAAIVDKNRTGKRRAAARSVR